MKHIVLAAAVSLAAGAAFATQTPGSAPVATATTQDHVVISTKNTGAVMKDKPYAYQTPFGVGPYNDSR